MGFLVPYFAFLLYGIPHNYCLLASSFLLTFAIYSHNKLTDLEEDAVNVPERAGFIEENKKTVIITLSAAYVAALLLAFLINPFAIVIILFPIFCGLVYSIKIAGFRLKDITGIKNVVVSLPWAVIGAFLPAAVYLDELILIPLVFYFFFVKLIINTVLFDVRDIEGDRLAGVKTVPSVIGRERTQTLLLVLNSTFIPWLLLTYCWGFFHQYLLVFAFIILYGYWYILYFCSREKIGKSLDLLVDGEWIPVAALATAVVAL